MGHVTFVHGIANKPAPDLLLEQWRTALFDNGGLNLPRMGVTSSMVYWADMFHATPASVQAALESTTTELESTTSPDDADMQWLARLPDEEAVFVEALAARLGLETVSSTPGDGEDPIRPDSTLEWIPLPADLKRRMMRALLREVHHYLYDSAFSPRPGETFRIRSDVRARTLQALRAGAQQTRPHVVIGHSLGSVIAYDVLTGVPDAPRVDALLTVGSPLGIDEVQQKLTPPWTRHDGWPSARLGDRGWCNVSDLLDPVCGGLGHRFAGDFRCAGEERILDLNVSNEGSWRHSIHKYLGQKVLRDQLRAMLR